MTRLIVKSIACAVAAGALLAFRTTVMAQLPDSDVDVPGSGATTGVLMGAALLGLAGLRRFGFGWSRA